MVLVKTLHHERGTLTICFLPSELAGITLVCNGDIRDAVVCPLVVFIELIQRKPDDFSLIREAFRDAHFKRCQIFNDLVILPL